MNERRRRVAAALSLVGGGLAVISAIPSGWYGVEPTDSYLFDPTVFSPFWIERTLMPLLSLGAGVGLLVGVGALVYRDWERSRLHRVAGAATVLGGLTLLSGQYGPEFLTPNGTPVGPITSLAALALLLWGGLLLIVGGLLFAYSSLSAGRTLLGWAMFGFLPAVFLLSYLLSGWLGDVGSSLALLGLAAVLARELEMRGPVSDSKPT